MKKIKALIMSAALAFTVATAAAVSVAVQQPKAVYAASYQPYVAPAVSYNVQKSEVNIQFPEGNTTNAVFCNGRLCVPAEEGAKLMGGKLEKQGETYRITVGDKTLDFVESKESNRPVFFDNGGVPYISLYELITPFEYEMLADIEKNSAQIIKEAPSEEQYYVAEKQKGRAYIRLEDIVADGLDDNGNYKADMLEKLKYTAEYLYMNDQQYYIAWVPLYANPKANYWNDVSKKYNLYNSYFVYVLDYMVDHNGHLGLHGYTHQYANDISCIGHEWGKNTPLSVDEQQRRMRAAKELCARLGYKEEFFEFPHYSATNEQLLMAEYYFDIIYQGFPDYKLANCMTETARSGKRVLYIPTPADYVHFKRDYAIIQRLDNAISKGYLVSMYFHPKIDDNKFIIETVDGVRTWKYDKESCLPTLIEHITKKGYRFASII